MDVRAALSQAVRIMACNISEAQLMSRPQLIARYLDFVVTTADFCQRSSELSYWDCQPLRYCCCSVVAACVGECRA